MLIQETGHLLNFLKVDLYSHFAIVSVENDVSHSYTEQKGVDMLREISETVGKFVLILSQNLSDDFYEN